MSVPCHFPFVRRAIVVPITFHGILKKRMTKKEHIENERPILICKVCEAGITHKGDMAPTLFLCTKLIFAILDGIKLVYFCWYTCQ